MTDSKKQQLSLCPCGLRTQDKLSKTKILSFCSQLLFLTVKCEYDLQFRIFTYVSDIVLDKANTKINKTHDTQTFMSSNVGETSKQSADGAT